MGNLSSTMAGLVSSPLISAGTQLYGQVLDASSQASQQKLAMNQLKSQQALEEGQAAEDAATRKATLAAQAAATESARKTALKKAIAKQRALFASQGISASGGSSEALLLGVYDDSEDEGQDNAQINALKEQAIDESVSQLKQSNLLEASHLAEQQKLSRILSWY